MGLSLQLVLDLSTRAVLLLDHVHLALCLSLVLLLANHRLNLMSSLLLIHLVDSVLFAVHLLFLFCVNGFLLRFHESHLLILAHRFCVFLFHVHVHLSFRSHFRHLVLLALELLPLHFHVAAALPNDVRRPLPRFVDLPHCLHNFKLALVSLVIPCFLRTSTTLFCCTKA